ncbi:ABC transporter ATP-binding protein [Clostridium sardiniense]|uniref:ABC transporter ATP-binding protein n=1 Tax=Clostridium sardiniense TaxID=29369 RepID=A0ABS7L1E1_CLOSR|nr:ABC transporter ATP-binding protein [Clostridium sardiniense]MBY0756878.1 ABC transporter ATP-binding protein [Clostridium sardiniense]MDQ0458723.1 multiple sugar transport system ATP-binding protein [Clostridium sardiniense]
MRRINYVVFEDLVKRYKGSNKNVIENFNLSIDKGEFIVIVGSSGSGKSTLLEMICGFEEITEGSISIDNKIINDIEPKDRDISMVFQNYALLPHLTAYENIAFGMKIRKVNKEEIDKKVMWVAKILHLEEYLNVKPKKLSGGQRQRIALARAIVRKPKLFLMDEPLSNLDAKLRNETCNEIVALHKKINATTIYVTHDQTEALTMADRIVVLNDGRVEQVGTPKELYTNPSSIFVATFLGKPQMNLFEMKIKDERVILNDLIDIGILDESNRLNKDEYIIGFRAEDIQISEEGNSSIRAIIEKIEYLGSETILYLDYEGIKFTTKTYKIKDFKINEKINISFNLKNANIFNKHNKRNIRGEQNEEKNN